MGKLTWLIITSIVVVTCGVILNVWVKTTQMMGGWNGVTGMTLLWTRDLQDIRTADVDYLPWYFQGERADAGKVVFISAVKAIFGLATAQMLMKSADYSYVVWGSDTDSKVCRRMLDYMWVSPLTSGFSYPSVYGGYDEIKEWIKACKAVWPELGDEEKALLQVYKTAGDMPFDLLVPHPDDNNQIKTAARNAKEKPAWEESEKYTREELIKIIEDSMEHSQYGALGVKEVPESIVDYFMMLNMRKPVEILGTWKAVGDQIRTGRITKFDARQLIPPEYFNISFKTMREWEGEASKRIPVFSDGLQPGSFAHFANQKTHWVQEINNRASICIANEDMVSVNGRGTGFPHNVTSKLSRIPMWYSPPGYMHTRRLPVFHSKLPNVEKAMGIEQDVLRGQSMLWMGSTPGGFHYDEEANVYIQLTGYTYAFLVPQNWTDYFTGAIRHPWGSAGLPGFYELEKDPQLKDVPIFLIPMGPGDGITLHGRTYHRFMAQTYDRISLNWFFIPKWRKMEYTPADWYALEAKRSMTRLALRQWWARTLTRVYEDTGKGIIYMGTKLEYI